MYLVIAFVLIPLYSDYFLGRVVTHDFHVQVTRLKVLELAKLTLHAYDFSTVA